MKVCFETFGCRLNKAEALQMEAEYLARGWTRTEEHKDADLFIVRGCSVTSSAQSECERLIAHLKKHYPSKPIRVCGCLPDKGYLPPEPPAADMDAAPVPTRTARAYLKVQDGCSGRCTFCTVPRFRGKSVSVDFNKTLDRSKRFIESGYHEIVVTGCNLSLYASQGKRLPDLVDALASLDAGCRIRLGSVEPGSCALETVHAMSARPNACRFLHLPVQSGSIQVLLAMRRSYDIKAIGETVEAATRLMPQIGLGCDLITGFPGETELDFAATKSLIRRHRFSNAHVFPFSARPGTVAATLPHSLPHGIRSSRAHELSGEVSRVRTSFAQKFVGHNVDVLVEREQNGKSVGWTSEYLRCEISGPAARKALVRVFVTEAKGDRLFGTLAR